MTIVNEFFPTLSGGTGAGDKLVSDATRIVGDATRAVTVFPAYAWDRLNRRDDLTGEPIGSVAVLKDRMMRMVALRLRKTFSRPYGRRTLR